MVARRSDDYECGASSAWTLQGRIDDGIDSLTHSPNRATNGIITIWTHFKDVSHRQGLGFWTYSRDPPGVDSLGFLIHPLLRCLHFW